MNVAIVIIILAAVIILLILDVFPSSLTVLGGCILLAACGIITWEEAFSGFSGSVPLLVLGTNMVALGLQHTGAARDFGALLLRFGGRSQRSFTLISCLAAILLSSVMSNIMVMAILMPMVGAACYASEGKLKRKYTYMALGIASNMGGSLTLIGAPQNMLVSGCLETAGEAPLTLFSYTPFGIVRSVLCLVFFATIGDFLQKRFFDFEEPGFEEASPVSSGPTGDLNVPAGQNTGRVPVPDSLSSVTGAETPSKRGARYWCSVLALVLMIAGFISGIWPIHAVALACGLLSVMAGTIPFKTCLQKLPWNIILLLAGSSGLGMAISKSGAGDGIASWMIRMLGGHPGLFAALVAFTLLAFVMSNLMSATALVSVFVPVAIAFFQKMNYPAVYAALAIGTALNFACVLPYATPPITMTMEGGYRVRDYLIVGGAFALLGIVTQILMYPFIFLSP